MDLDGDTPLFACEDAVCADILLEAGADILRLNLLGETAYHSAVSDLRVMMVAWFQYHYEKIGVPLPEVIDEENGSENYEEQEVFEDLHEDAEEEK